MSIQPGQTILNDKYRILRLIGEGGMARVWLAEELTFGSRLVALKEPRDDLLPAFAQEVRQRYQREVQVCAALEKAKVPNTVRALTAEPYGETVLLVMEYMPGGDLSTLLREQSGSLPLEQALRISLDLLKALEGVHAHELEIVHRDIKPSNVLFDEQGKAHLADFGLAQLAGVSGRSQLRGGQHPGTPMYMAPEQAQGLDVLLPAADLYAVGCVLFEMLTRKRYKRVRPGTLPSALQADVPRWLDEVVTRAFAEDPWERYTEAAEMAEHLRAGTRVTGSPVRVAAGDERVDAPDQAVSSGMQPSAELEAIPVWQRIGIEMVTIPAGEFLYGEKKERVLLPEYAMARTPVTNVQYQAFVETTGHRAPRHWKRGHIPEGKKDHPVVEVSWHDAQAFCEWVGGRLPTEQEWEKGARGTDGRKYPWGDEWEEGRCNTKEAGDGDTTRVGHYANGASPYGLLDMAGNVWEWCGNWYDAKRDRRVLRGGSWGSTRDMSHVAFRYGSGPDGCYRGVGFRCLVQQETERFVGVESAETNTVGPGKAAEAGKHPTAELESVPMWQRIGIDMVAIPEGEFLYGENKERLHLPEYAISRTPVTNAQHQTFVEATGHPAPPHWRDGRIPQGKEDHPVVDVCWQDALAFCEWAGCSLPTEQESEKGARGTDGRCYPWGDQWEEGRCNTIESRIGDTTPVGHYPDGASPYGLLDMAGNVWEWCQIKQDETLMFPILRGGSWFSTRKAARCSFRASGSASTLNEEDGFRCAVSSMSSLEGSVSQRGELT